MNSHDDEVRALLEEAVADVEPRPGLHEIRARTTPARSRRPWLWGAGGAVLATAATIAAVAVLGGGPGTTDAAPGPATQPAPGTETPQQKPDDTATTAGAGAEPVTVAVYYVGDTGHGPRLFKELHRVTTDNPALAAARLAVEGTPDDPDYRSLWPAGTRVENVSLDGSGADGTAGIGLTGTDLARRPRDLTDREATLALQQVVYSVDDAIKAKVGFDWYLDGTREQSPLGQQPPRAAGAMSAEDTLAQVLVATPADGAVVDSPFTVTGEAAAFEANVQWELEQDGAVVQRGFTTAEECCTLSPYSFTVQAPPGTYTLVVHDEDPSGGEGLPPWQDTKQVTVR